MITKHLFVLLACLFVVMIGLGITMPVLPFYVERLALAEGVSRQLVVIHVGLLTGVYALGQLIFAPVWGRLSDRTGRRSLILIGIAGYALAQVLFGLAASLWLLYAARILGGILSSATLPVSAAYVADMTTDEERGRGMAWLSTAVSLGFVVGPALGGILSRRDLHFTARYGHFMIDSFSVPFFAAAALGLLTLFAAMRWLPESLAAHAPHAAAEKTETDWRRLVRNLGPLLGLALVGQFGLAIFEATFALYSQAKFNYGPVEVGTAFVVCGLVMSVFQVGAVGFLAGRISEIYQIGAGFGLMGMSLALMVMARTTFSVLALVGLLALGTAFISPNLAALISKRGGSRRVGAALGVQNAANSLGQASGPLLGGVLFVWQVNAPYLLTAALLVIVALVIAWKGRERRTQPELSDHAEASHTKAAI
ncbi:MFS transporter [Candidatus Binatus sp.]|uniref:MFS transporter n=1 Tax=Candidatus Binatus sp. TaxID=2811406 RepID=UPI002FD8BCC2